MVLKYIASAACTFLAVVSFSASAVGINGLDWSPFNNTLSMSANQVDAALLPGGSLEGWRFATVSEVESMFTSVHPGWVDGLSPANQGFTDELAALLGYTYGEPGKAREITGVTADSGGGACCRAAYNFQIGFRGQPVTEDYVHLTIVNRNGTTNQFSRPIASFLVSAAAPVPVPAAVWLFGSGLIGLIGVARVKRI